MSEEKPKRKNDAEAYIQEWVKGEQNARRYVAAWFVLVTLFFLFLFNPFQYFGVLDGGFIAFYLGLIAIPVVGAIILLIFSNNEDWIRNQIEKSVEKYNNVTKYAGFLFLATAVLQFITRSAEQKFLIAPCMLGIAIYWFWRSQKFQQYFALVGEEKAK